MITIAGQIFENVYTSAEWSAANPILDDRVQGFDSTVKAFKIGDGITAWNSLGFYYPTTPILPTRLSKTTGTALPIVLAYSSLYSAYGNEPTIQIRLSTTGQDITALATIIYGSSIPLNTISIDVMNDEGSVPSLSAGILIIIKS